MLTPSDKIRQLIIFKATGEKLETLEEIQKWFAEKYDYNDDAYHDTENDLRSGEYETGLQKEYSRHYESRAVASQMLDGSWVGWTHWYGGGKYGESRSIKWVEDAYELEMTETTKVVKEFRKPAASS